MSVFWFLVLVSIIFIIVYGWDGYVGIVEEVYYLINDIVNAGLERAKIDG